LRLAVPEQVWIVAEQEIVEKIGGLVVVRTIERGRWTVLFAPAKKLSEHRDLALVFRNFRRSARARRAASLLQRCERS